MADDPKPAETLVRELRAGRGEAELSLARLPPAIREAILFEALTRHPDVEPPVESRRGSFHARLLSSFATPALGLRLLASLEGDMLGSAPGYEVLTVLDRLAAFGWSLPSLPLLRLLTSTAELQWRLPALRLLARGGELPYLERAADSTLGDLEDPFDAKDWGEAMAHGGEAAGILLRRQLSSPRPLDRLAAAFGLAHSPDGAPPVEDEVRETLADLLSFDPEGTLRAHALELREDSGKQDPYRVGARLLRDPESHPFLESWHWSLASECLQPEDLTGVLQALDSSRIAGADEIAELLSECAHPLAPALLRSRALQGNDEDRICYLRALEYLDYEIGPELLEGFQGDPPPPRVLVLRARQGQEEDLEQLVSAVVSGRLGPGDLEETEDALVLEAALPRVRQRLETGPPLVRARLLRVFRARIPSETVPPFDPSGLDSEDLDLAAETAMDLATRLPVAAPALGRLLDSGPPERQLLVIDALRRAGDPQAAALVEPCLASGSPRIRREALRALADLLAAEQPAPEVLALLDDPHGGVRAEALATCRDLGLPVPADRIEACLRDGTDEVRSQAVQLLGLRRPPGFRALLERARDQEVLPWLRGLIDEHLASPPPHQLQGS